MKTLHDLVKDGVYLHRKTGNYYKILTFAKSEKTGRVHVVYRRVEDTRWLECYLRPIEEWEEEVEVNGEKGPRFLFVEQQ